MPYTESFVDGDMHITIHPILDGHITRFNIEILNWRTFDMALFQSHTLDDIISKLNRIVQKTKRRVKKKSNDENERLVYLEYEDEGDLAESSNRKPLVKYLQDDNLYNITYLWNDIILRKSDLQALYKAQKIKNEMELVWCIRRAN